MCLCRFGINLNRLSDSSRPRQPSLLVQRTPLPFCDDPRKHDANQVMPSSFDLFIFFEKFIVWILDWTSATRFRARCSCMFAALGSEWFCPAALQWAVGWAPRTELVDGPFFHLGWQRAGKGPTGRLILIRNTWAQLEKRCPNKGKARHPGPQMWAVPVSLARKGTKPSKRIYEISLFYQPYKSWNNWNLFSPKLSPPYPSRRPHLSD